MKIRLIEIDTNGDNAYKFTQNVELYDLIVPNIVFLVDDSSNVIMADEFDWEATRKSFYSFNNGHCIYNKEGFYTAAYEFTHIGVKVDENSYVFTLSELCDELAELNNINSWLNSRK